VSLSSSSLFFIDASVCVVAAGKKKERCNQKPTEYRQRQEADCQHANINKRNENSAIAVGSAVALVTGVNIRLLNSLLPSVTVVLAAFY